jgi:putative transposase
VDGNLVKVPKIGWLRFWKSREIEGTIKNVTIRREGKDWLVSFQTEREVEIPVHPSTSALGLDLGIATFAATSDGTLHPPLNAYRKAQKALAKAQRRAAKKVKFSQNWQKCQTRIRRIYTQIAHCRQDFLHKLSTQISQNHAVVVVEDLQVRNMSRSATGTVEEPGTNVAAKSGLNKSILDQGWRTFRTMLEYKQRWRGGEVIAVSPRHTSQECPQCHHVSRLNRPQQALFLCTECGYSYHADVVAARNILTRGLRERLTASAASLTLPGILAL